MRSAFGGPRDGAIDPKAVLMACGEPIVLVSVLDRLLMAAVIVECDGHVTADSLSEETGERRSDVAAWLELCVERGVLVEVAEGYTLPPRLDIESEAAE